LAIYNSLYSLVKQYGHNIAEQDDDIDDPRW